MILVQLSDLHVRPRGRTVSRVVDSNTLAERALRAVTRMRPRPDAVVISGDLTDCGLEAEYAELVPMLRRYLGDMRLLLIPGNHDRREAFRTALAEFEGVTRDPEFVQFVVDDLPLRLVMLDSVVPGAGHGALCERRLGWLEARLAEAPNRPTLLVLHHPPMRSGMAVFDAINLHTTPELGAVLARHPQVERVLCGHHHRVMAGRLGQVPVLVAPSVAHQGAFELDDDRGRMTLEPPGYFVHVALPEGGVVSHHVFVDDYPGPFPYLEEPDYPGGHDIALER